MTASKSLCLPLAAVLLAAGFSLTAPAHAALSPAEETHCLALGMTLTKMGAMEAEIVTMLKDGLGADASDEDKATLKQLDELSVSTTNLGKALEAYYADAAKPGDAELEALNQVNMDELVSQAEKCAQQNS